MNKVISVDTVRHKNAPREMHLSHVVHYTHVSTAVAVIIRVIFEITWGLNRPLK